MTRWSADYHTQNRRKLAQKIDGGFVAIAGHVAVQRSNDTAQPFKQDANMWYLSGVTEPGWQLLYDGTRDYAWLVRPDTDEVTRIFDGGIDDAQALARSGADTVIAQRDLEQTLRQIARTHSAAYALDPKPLAASMSFALNPAAARLYAVLERIFAGVTDVRRDMAQLRAVKTEDELAVIRAAVQLTTRAFEHVRENIASYRHEYEIEAEFGYRFRRANAQFAYDPIVAGGKNACTLHYIANDAARPKRGAVLIDVGAEVDGYCADITRTYGWTRPTKRVEQLHAALRTAHHEIIDLIEPHMPVADYQRQVDDIMKRQMVSVGLLTSTADEAYRTYFPHAVSHGLGIDVHDSLGGTRLLEPGMVITVEPGLYLADEGIGLRIEDDVVVTATGHENLSASLSTSLM